MKKVIYFLSILISFTALYSCIEEFEAATTEFEDVIVIEATLTNELKNHVVKLTRTYKFEDGGPSSETGANVKIITNNTTYTFSEISSGVYASNEIFKAEIGVPYSLEITTRSGREYKSKDTQLTNITAIDDVYAAITTNKDGVEGIGLFVDSFDATNSSKYYGYEFDETYKIVVPYWFPTDLILTDNGGIREVPKSQEEETCYNTIASKGRLLTNTTLLGEDRVNGFLLKFIANDDIRVNTRYSILVKQYIQSRESYNYLRVLEEFSESQSLFSQVQPGFLASNIFSLTNENEKVLGFFEVSSVSEKRYFFNREDILNTDYPWPCAVTEPTVQRLISQLRNNRVKLIGVLDPQDPIPYQVVNRLCGDCTASGSNIRPDFWED
ncbi:DUF4249 domain-containing protein [Polaribacter sp. Hel_I_88]|uniref:DUF4249 domain-containing protein n=1 Tax=Polaribacter sp. Hel_I_88 TaxID=1250006 RepID=UPI00068F4892|nr:DUF4249 domain-containing protein [Polaribacter sp. Hel_I_88]